MTKKEFVHRRFRDDFRSHMNRTLEDAVNEIPAETNIGSKAYHSNPRILGYLIAGSSAYAVLAVPKDSHAGPIDWSSSVNITEGTDALGFWRQFEYSILNMSDDNTLYNLTSLIIGAGNDESGQVYIAGGGAQNDFNWTQNILSDIVSFSYSPNGDPISPGGNPLTDYGTFILRTRQEGMDMIAFNAESSAGGPFPEMYQWGPATVPEPSTLALFLVGGYVALRKKINQTIKNHFNKSED